jgi:hypothetical protein
MTDPTKHGVWKTNTEAYIMTQKTICCECVVFGERVLVIGEIPVESTVSGLALPLG